MRFFIILLLTAFLVGCTNSNDQYFIDYCYDLRSIEEPKLMIYRSDSDDSVSYFYYHIEKQIKGNDTLIIQKSFDHNRKYDSSICILSNKEFTLKEYYFYSLDSTQNLQRVNLVKGEFIQEKLNKKHEFEFKIEGDVMDLRFKSISKVKEFDNYMFNGNSYKGVVLVNKMKIYNGFKLLNTSVDTLYSAKKLGVFKRYAAYLDSYWILDTIIDYKDFENLR